MKTVDERILTLIEILKTLKIIRFDTEFCDSIEIKKQNLNRIKKGDVYFTTKHIDKIIKIYQVNANWIFGVSDKIFLTHKFNPMLEKIDVDALIKH